ncbi:uncharacterized protein LOC126970778 [Leptidea sinapis]|uniref:uncharacterized protein LOC126970778 n=1 Tax=Leptidea sinapis TaxID=189913 RepID=UPI0021C2EE6E|nr:uncharacterized protein LOC126970778 [Leptidea sinapis]
MESQLQLFFDKIKTEMNNQTKEILSQIDEKLKPLVLEIEELKRDNIIKVQSRWKTARDTYMKVKASKKKLKSGAGASTNKKYIFFQMLTFLDSNSSNEADESIENQCEDQDSSTNAINYNSSSVPSTSTSNSNLERTNNTEPESSRKRKRQVSPTAFEKELLQCVKQNNLDSNDEDLNFFKSLIPTVQKLLFRNKVLEALIDIQKETVITLDDLPSINIGLSETQNTTSTIDLRSLNIGTETQNTDTIEY